MNVCPYPIRETPTVKVVVQQETDPAMQVVFDEPVLKIEHIQGSIVPGLNKSHRLLVFLRVDRTCVAGFKAWLNSQVPFVATADEVLAFNRLFKQTRLRRRREGTVKSTWMNIAFSFDFLTKLDGSAECFTDEAFRDGLTAERAFNLGDPLTGPYAPENWFVGGALQNKPDVLLIVEADDRDDMLEEWARLEQSLERMTGSAGERIETGATVIFVDEGANLPGPLSGHEHFGFLDGVSQPGLRGLLPGTPPVVLTPRQNPDKRDTPEDVRQKAGPTNPIQPAQGKPGQDLLYPGEFIFGYSKQKKKPADDADGLNPRPGPDSLSNPNGDGKAAGPEWAKDGSFLVYRRLRQDVGAFHQFLLETAQAQHIPQPRNSSPARYVGAKLVGRWPSGAPVLREPDAENPQLGGSDCSNNNFEFQDDTDPIEPRSDDPLACVDTDPPFPQATNDSHGSRCPFSAHIRKSYPRDDVALGVPPPSDPELGEAATQTHRLLRRGLPYGPVSSSTPETPIFDCVDRGLQFLAYQTSIKTQFEFVIKNWVNPPDFKEPFQEKGATNTGMPEDQGGGHDPIIGQNASKDGSRKRTFTITKPDAADPAKTVAVQLSTEKEWVFPTGGGYFFTPSIAALLLLSK